MIELGQKTCEGCNVSVTKRSDKIGGQQCSFVDFNVIIICPCVECLLKMICSKPCGDRIRARGLIIDLIIRGDDRPPHVVLNEDYK